MFVYSVNTDLSNDTVRWCILATYFSEYCHPMDRYGHRQGAGGRGRGWSAAGERSHCPFSIGSKTDHGDGVPSESQWSRLGPTQTPLPRKNQGR